MLRYYLGWVVLLCCLHLSNAANGQLEHRKVLSFYDAQHRLLPSSKGANYAIETEYLDSIRAIERVYWRPQKLREVAYFSNIRLRRRDGETVVYYDDGSIKRREQYRDGFQQGEGFAYYPNGQLSRHATFDNQKRQAQECFDTVGKPISCDTLTARQQVCPGAIQSAGQGAQVRYPQKALKLGIEGVVKVEFVVSRTGQLAYIQVLQSPSPILSAAAIDAIRRTKWGVRLDNCDPVDVRYTMPFTFAIK